MTQAVAQFNPDQQRMSMLADYKPSDHMATWTARDPQGRSQIVKYYPAAWRLYELSLRYTNANFSSDIITMDQERDFVIVRARLYLGANYELSEKKAEAYKQGKLTQLDRVETKAKARAARDFGIGTEHALDFDDVESGEVLGSVSVVEASAAPQEPQSIRQLPEASPQPEPAVLVDQAGTPINASQLETIRKICKAMQRAEPEHAQGLTYLQAKGLIQQLTSEYNARKEKIARNKGA